ncbi:hypothetical protein L596_020761 [Steinernema carpocapsae]|uniref:Uncharacterized protein n=1 Tax=Steinernema carpocapsae TaxID=34508 RepID=A0A4U5MV93_STECR|nr:hypothetical protein L596_020761 [Steinernema carpocapsae]
MKQRNFSLASENLKNKALISAEILTIMSLEDCIPLNGLISRELTPDVQHGGNESVEEALRPRASSLSVSSPKTFPRRAEQKSRAQSQAADCEPTTNIFRLAEDERWNPKE